MFIFNKILSLIGLLLLTNVQIACANPELEKAIQGRWLTEITQELPAEDEVVNGLMKIIGVDEYLGNGAVNLQGQLVMTFNYKNGTQLTAAWLVNAASEWQIKNGFLYEKVIDVRATPDFVKLNGSLVSPDQQKDFFQQSQLKIEDIIPKGHTSEDEIISIDDKSFSYKAKNDQGNTEVRNKTKTKSAFSLYRIK